MGSIEGPGLVFSEVNALLKRMGKPPLFSIKMVGLSKATPVCNGMCAITSDLLATDIAKTEMAV